MTEQTVFAIRHLEEEVAGIRGQIAGAKWIFGIAISIIVLLAGSWALNLQRNMTAVAAENKAAVKENTRTSRENEKAIQRYEAIATEQDRRLGRIEGDIKEIKESQAAITRKLDQLILERSFRDPAVDRR